MTASVRVPIRCGPCHVPPQTLLFSHSFLGLRQPQEVVHLFLLSTSYPPVTLVLLAAAVVSPGTERDPLHKFLLQFTSHLGIKAKTLAYPSSQEHLSLRPVCEPCKSLPRTGSLPEQHHPSNSLDREGWKPPPHLCLSLVPKPVLSSCVLTGPHYR